MSVNVAVNGARARSAKHVPGGVSPLKVSDSTIKDLTDVFRMLADPSRLRIILSLTQDHELHVSALCTLLGQSQPAVSHHLTLMRMVGLVDFSRRGKHNFYRLSSTRVRHLLEEFFADHGNGSRQLQFDDFALCYKRRT
jgi:ArsR family transcriptional regulator, arsenate/arsenite/antimonite-responsive transcriptional repressor